MSAKMDEQSIITKAFWAAWAFVTVLGGALWKSLNARISGKASKETVGHTLEKLDEHIEEDRDVHLQIVQRLDVTNAQLNQIIGKLDSR
jgi:hypothetical protein